MNNENSNSSEPVVTYEELEGRLREAEANIEAKNNILEMANRSLTKWREKVEALTKLVQAEFDKGGWDEDDEFFQGLCRYLDIETEEEVEVMVRAEWVVTLKVRKGTHLNLGDISVDVDEPSIDCYASGVEVQNIGYAETSVDEY